MGGGAGRGRVLRFSGSGESFRGGDLRVEAMRRRDEKMKRGPTVEVCSSFQIKAYVRSNGFRRTRGAAIVEGIGGATGVEQERIVGEPGWLVLAADLRAGYGGEGGEPPAAGRGWCCWCCSLQGEMEDGLQAGLLQAARPTGAEPRRVP